MRDRPRLLDLFSGAGGAAAGYVAAGFDVTGVDNRPQPNFPYRFVLADALEYAAAHGHEYDAIHASPPCHRYSAALNIRTDAEEHRANHPDLVAATRELLESLGKPFVIENVPGAPLRNPIILCGAMFNLRVIRHRLFETSFGMSQPPHIPHAGTVQDGYYCTVAGNGGAMKDNNGRKRLGSRLLADWQEAMGIDWMRKYEITLAIPPAYTKFVGKQIMEAIS